MKKLEEVLKDWEAVIGLEVHAELTTLETKMFCGCKLSNSTLPPNTHTCVRFVSVLPGALPVPNKSGDRIDRVGGSWPRIATFEKSLDVLPQELLCIPDMSKNFQINAGSCRILHARASRSRGGSGAAC